MEEAALLLEEVLEDLAGTAGRACAGWISGLKDPGDRGEVDLRNLRRGCPAPIIHAYGFSVDLAMDWTCLTPMDCRRHDLRGWVIHIQIWSLTSGMTIQIPIYIKHFKTIWNTLKIINIPYLGFTSSISQPFLDTHPGCAQLKPGLWPWRCLDFERKVCGLGHLKSVSHYSLHSLYILYT